MIVSGTCHTWLVISELPGLVLGMLFTLFMNVLGSAL